MSAVALAGLVGTTASATLAGTRAAAGVVPWSTQGWHPPVLVDAPTGTPAAVACAAAEACWAVDFNGNAARFDGTSWTVPVAVNPFGRLASISCPRVDRCVAVGDDQGDGVSVVWDGQSWGTPTAAARQALDSVVCLSKGFCLASDYTGHVYELRHGHWGQATTLGRKRDSVQSISCPSRTFCVAVRRHGGGDVFDGSHWTAVDPITTRGGLSAVSCPTVSFCMAVGTHSSAVYDGTTWSTLKRAERARVTSVSCPSPTRCVAVNIFGGAVTYDGTRWSGVTAVVPEHLLISVSCATTSFCESVGFTFDDGDGASATFDGTAWNQPVEFDATAGGISAVSCASEAFCVAADAHGAVTTYDGSSWTTPLTVDPGQWITAVSCPTSSFCVALDVANQAVTYDGADWSAPVLIEPQTSIVVDLSCFTSRFCVAVDTRGFAVTYNGHRWSAPVLAATTGLYRVSCSSRTLCVATGGSGNATTFDGSTWAETDLSADHLADVSCTPSRCTAVTQAGDALVLHDGAWGAPNSIETGNDIIWSISCAGGICRAVTEDGNVITGRARHWSKPVLIDPNRQLKGISCATAQACLAYDTKSFVVATF